MYKHQRDKHNIYGKIDISIETNTEIESRTGTVRIVTYISPIIIYVEISISSSHLTLCVYRAESTCVVTSTLGFLPGACVGRTTLAFVADRSAPSALDTQFSLEVCEFNGASSHARSVPHSVPLCLWSRRNSVFIFIAFHNIWYVDHGTAQNHSIKIRIRIRIKYFESLGLLHFKPTPLSNNPLPPPSAHTPSAIYSHYRQKANNALTIILALRVSMDGSDRSDGTAYSWS
ncbi:hypothetical protein EVAR_9095_1 [Eumeta japonica]|uniref:Uncharacterized protein n=1 Tax=Eumeta variegata TaxID=151549 RepID=A0A4C1TW34_EUMVA|nr:hypothetical protein EVAR_9095_1 [Eumeta japonica]